MIHVSVPEDVHLRTNCSNLLLQKVGPRNRGEISEVQETLRHHEITAGHHVRETHHRSVVVAPDGIRVSISKVLRRRCDALREFAEMIIHPAIAQHLPVDDIVSADQTVIVPAKEWDDPNVV
eukprot:GAFH01003922.1.p2 GENE.GAFH01003922.1~~GAFH01003922.1.p2  ORF type:complete len:122 (+),score=1.08 GAFH01003922.1:179-544(+)